MKHDPLQQTCSRILNAVLPAAAARDRYLVAIAGPPASGKSTLADALAARLPAGVAAVFPMDGFHYDDAVLEVLGLRARKGAPETFDFEGFYSCLARLRRRESLVAIPVFHRPTETAHAAARLIRSSVKFIFIEGNYLLLDESPWHTLNRYFDFSVFLKVDPAELERRLMQRWLALGFTAERAANWIQSNDKPNIERVLAHVLPASSVEL